MSAPFLERPLMDGVQKVYRFANGYGASVVRHFGSYGSSEGLWELGVVKFDGDAWHLTYATPITSDVLGYLSDEAVDAAPAKIEALA